MSGTFQDQVWRGLHVLCAITLAVICVVSAGYAQTPAGKPTQAPAPPTACPEESAALLEGLVVGPDLARQREIADALQRIPPRDNAMAAEWMIAHADRLDSSFLVKLASRLQQLGRRDEAMEWVALFVVRLSYDAKRCADPLYESSATFALMSIGQVFPDLDEQGLKPLLPALGKAVQRAVRLPDAFTAKVGPEWICTGNRLSDAPARLKPESEWPSIRAELTRQITRVIDRDSKGIFGKPDGAQD